MRLFIDGSEQEFIPIKTFREAYHLPPAFGVNLFEPKDFTGLGSLERAGGALSEVREAVLREAAMPRTLVEWMSGIADLVGVFTAQLEAINPAVGLKQVEIEFAAGGFGDVLHAVTYELFRARASKQPPLPFARLYGAWLNSSVRVSQTVHKYPYDEHRVWEIQIVTTAYGRAGLIVYGDDGTHYVYDLALGCPAEGFMVNLLSEIAALIYDCA
ncbi:MAG: hypothetical protein IAE80_01295 [Anaerolinea sp.]|nr:hypothetical protein [Anaerolinea sp.]